MWTVAPTLLCASTPAAAGRLPESALVDGSSQYDATSRPIGSSALREQESPTAGPGSRPRGWRLATLLFLFGATLIVPSIVANGLLLQRQAGLQQRDVERRVEQVAADLVDGIDRDLALLEAMATLMAASPDLAAGRLEQFHGWATQILQPLGLRILYRDLDGQQLLNTRVPFGTALPREILPEIDAAVRATLKPYVSDMLVGAVRQNFVITVTAPVVVDGALRGFLHFSIDPERMLELMKGQELPPEWNTTPRKMSPRLSTSCS